MATTAEHIAARNDSDLYQRLVAAAEIQGIPNAAQWVEQNRGALVSTEIAPGGDTTSITNIHAYAVATYEPRLRPGEDPESVTDAYLIAAVNKVRFGNEEGVVEPEPEPEV